MYKRQKVRRLGLKAALSAKLADGKLIIIDTLRIKTPKTAELAKSLGKLGATSALMIDGEALDEGFERAAANLKHINLLPAQGANVYDILRCDMLVLSKDAVERLEARLK